MQKIIQCVQTPEEFAIVEQNLQPYTPPLLLNDCSFAPLIHALEHF